MRGRERETERDRERQDSVADHADQCARVELLNFSFTFRVTQLCFIVFKLMLVEITDLAAKITGAELGLVVKSQLHTLSHCTHGLDRVRF